MGLTHALLSGVVSNSKILNDTKHRAVSATAELLVVLPISIIWFHDIYVGALDLGLLR